MAQHWVNVLCWCYQDGVSILRTWICFQCDEQLIQNLELLTLYNFGQVDIPFNFIIVIIME